MAKKAVVKSQENGEEPAVPKKRKSTKKVEQVSTTKEEHIVVQLPISTERIRALIDDSSTLLNPLEYSPNIIDPEPYTPSNTFVSHSDAVVHTVRDVKNDTINTPSQNTIEAEKPNNNCCYWCCHAVGTKEFGLPIKYDTLHDNFTTFGCFCSLECVVAYNYSNYMGSDRMWEINSWIQWMGHKMGYEPPIRPAPSRYLLKMFNGPMEIKDFRELHKNYLKTYMLNMPPLIHIQGQVESINTSYLNQKTTTTSAPASSVPSEYHDDKVKLYRNSAVVDTRRTLDSKMNLTIKPLA